MSKAARQKAILDLLEQGPVESQDALQHSLVRRGFEVGQATLSRDIHELKLVKGPEGYARITESRGSDTFLPSVMHMAYQFVVEIRQAQNMLVIKTTVGSAQPVCAALDDEEWPEAVGSVAGDDTILIVCQNNKAASRLANRTQEMLA